MANANTPNGFVYDQYRSPRVPETRTFVKLVGVGTAIFINDVVHGVGGTSLSEGKTAIEPFGTATPGTTLPMGVALAYGAASAKTRHPVIIDTAAVYSAQDNGSTDGIGYADENLNANVVATVGNATTFFSKHQIDEASLNASASRDLAIIGIAPAPNNAVGSNYVRALCRFLKPRPAHATIGV